MLFQTLLHEFKFTVKTFLLLRFSKFPPKQGRHSKVSRDWNDVLMYRLNKCLEYSAQESPFWKILSSFLTQKNWREVFFLNCWQVNFLICDFFEQTHRGGNRYNLRTEDYRATVGHRRCFFCVFPLWKKGRIILYLLQKSSMKERESS